MRTPFRWTLTSRASLRALCACCALCGAPIAALAAPEQVASTAAVATAPHVAASSTSHNTTTRSGLSFFDRRVLTLLAMGYFVGMLIGWASGGPRETRFRLFNKPKKTALSVLVSPGPAPRLIPNDSPNAARARWTRDAVSRHTPAGAGSSGVIHYLAPFAGASETREDAHVDYLLELGDDSERTTDPADDPTPERGF